MKHTVINLFLIKNSYCEKYKTYKLDKKLNFILTLLIFIRFLFVTTIAIVLANVSCSIYLQVCNTDF